MRDPVLIVHVVNALRAGGLENGVINLINRLPAEKYRHAVICLTDYDDFAKRIKRSDVPLIALHKKPGKDLSWYWRMWRTLRDLRPDVVHSRNLATIETQLVAFTAGVSGRVHGEHGWDVYDLRGANKKYRVLRRILRRFIQVFVPLSQELEDYLIDQIGVPPERLMRICNGVDVNRFSPRVADRPVTIPDVEESDVVIGNVGRMEAVKDPMNLANAFILAAQRHSSFRERARLVLVGSGSLYPLVKARIEEAGLIDRVWLPGHRDDIPELLRSFDVFALPSKAEGISNTILEAMASGLPVIATSVGGNSELLEKGSNAVLVPSENSEQMADAMLSYVSSEERRLTHGQRSRELAISKFSIESMVENYGSLYAKLTSKTETSQSAAGTNSCLKQE